MTSIILLSLFGVAYYYVIYVWAATPPVVVSHPEPVLHHKHKKHLEAHKKFAGKSTGW